MGKKVTMTERARKRRLVTKWEAATRSNVGCYKFGTTPGPAKTFRRLLGRLSGGSAQFRMAELARARGVTERTISRDLEALSDAGLIDWDPPRTGRPPKRIGPPTLLARLNLDWAEGE